jgi:hypothetical protein
MRFIQYGTVFKNGRIVARLYVKSGERVHVAYKKHVKIYGNVTLLSHVSMLSILR